MAWVRAAFALAAAMTWSGAAATDALATGLNDTTPAWGDATETDIPPGVERPESSAFGAAFLGLLAAIAGVLACTSWVFIMQKRRQDKPLPPPPTSDQKPRSPKSDAGAEAPERDPSVPAHTVVDPAMWCVTPDQFFKFINDVYKEFPNKDPTVNDVVDVMVRPMCEESGTSYALQLNPTGVAVRQFVVHAWSQGVKQLGHAIKSANPTGGIWICFLSMPQALKPEEAEALLGDDLWESPFAQAINNSMRVLAARTQSVSLFERLWCIFELYCADERGTMVVPIGYEAEPSETTGPMGLEATCTLDSDTYRLQTCMEPKRDQIEEWLAEVQKQWAGPVAV